MDRRGRILVTCLVTGALIAPVLFDADGYPLSTYPMYSRARSEVVTLATAQAIDADGSPRTLSLRVVGESDDPLIVAGELRTAISDGRAEQRCAEIASRAIGWSGLPDDAVAIEVVTERHDVVDRALGGDSLAERTVHARCEVSS